MKTSRDDLARMLSELSEEALRYVERPILGAYYYTDGRDPDQLSDDDSNRFQLIGAALHEDEETIQSLWAWLHMIRKH